MTSMLRANEKAFGDTLAEINSLVNEIKDLDGDEKKARVRTAEEKVDNAHELVEQLELDVLDVPISERKPIQHRIKAYNDELTTAEKNLVRGPPPPAASRVLALLTHPSPQQKRAAVSMAGSQNARDELFGYDGSSENARQALVSNTERLDRTSQRLQDGHRVALETQEVAVSIMDNLHEQRETIERSRGRVQNVDSELSFSNRVLNGMIARAKRNKVVAFLIITIALALIIVIIYLIATKH
ncbi:uncharacterized protein MONBRDRAFT_7715 [Monosiga brevicollis MX1]|uniref:t-SNARE coiled-coil homology domain-containing protein n=1 Tax=Monosiga brevicollis TaxID=81824 RepID=A9UY36_MONBE|nr:uncharacterized protein MONBRDRAFT_7715 [Monosiga brevicollis MX1]EDQ89793.1 predicted protein [Monosiga brevicollis MX1]|eukprot:XP_001745215.1 hypothetical protein [Monosiga brevicollis MX1]